MSDREQLELEERATDVGAAPVPPVEEPGQSQEIAQTDVAATPSPPAQEPAPPAAEDPTPKLTSATHIDNLPVPVLPDRRKAVNDIATTITIVTVAMFFVVVNLDVVAGWFTQHDNLLESLFCLQTMTSIETLLGVKDWRLANAYSTMASCYSKLGRYGDAIKAERRARDLMAAVEGPDSSNVYVLDAELAQFMAHNKQYAEAEVLLGDTLEHLERLRVPTPWSKAYTMAVLLDIFLQEKKQAEAEVLALQLVPLDDRMQVETSYASYSPRSRLCSIYCKDGRLDEAEKVAREGVKAAEQANNPLSKSSAHETLGRVLVVRGNTEEARKEFDEALSQMRRKYGADDEKVAYWKSRFEEFIKQKNPYLE